MMASRGGLVNLVVILAPILAVGALGAGCAGSKLQTRSYPPPAAEELLAAVRARQAAVSAMNVEARATSWLGGERVRGTVQMLVGRQGQLRFEAEVALQGTVALLAVDGAEFTFVDNQKQIFRKGPACPANVAAMIRIPLLPAEVAAILLGDVPSSATGGGARVEWDGARGADVLVLPGPQGTTLWLGLRRPQPAAAAWDVIYLEGQAVGGKPGDRWRVAYDDFERKGPVALPRLVRFAEPGKGWDDGVEIKIRERVLNPTFPAGAFTLAVPEGYTVEQAGCGPR
jgi:outer membrane lipoprotein-sorting protein